MLRVVEHHHAPPRLDEGLRKDVRDSSTGTNGIEVRDADEDVLDAIDDRARLQDRRSEHHSHVVFLRRPIRRTGEGDDVRPVEVRLRTDLEQGPLGGDGVLHRPTSFARRVPTAPPG